MNAVSSASQRVLRVLIGVHGAAEDHDRVPFRRVARRLGAVGREPAVEALAPLERDPFEQPAAAGLAVLVDDGQDAHVPTVSAPGARKAGELGT